MITLSAVIITRNEAQHIKKCLNALDEELKSSNLISHHQTIVVDSNSSDDTLNIIKDFEDIEIISVVSENYYSAAMGRRIGSELAKQKYILFLDGDIELQKGWLDKAILVLLDNKVNGVFGNLIDVLYNSEGEFINTGKRYNIKKNSMAPTLGGNLIISRELLIKCGNYNPYLRFNEEAEMYSRFLNYGTILQTTDIMAKHHTDLITNKKKIIDILNLKLEYGRALAFKESFKNNNLINLIWIYQDFTRTFLFSLLSFSLLLLSFFNITVAIVCIITLNFINVAIYIYKRIPFRFFTDQIIAFKFLKALFTKNKEFPFSYEKHK